MCARPGRVHLPPLLVLCGLSCQPPAAPDDPRSAACSVPEVEFAGCQRLLAGPVCELGASRELTLWWRGEQALELRSAGAPVPVQWSRPASEGFARRYLVPEGSRALSLVRPRPSATDAACPEGELLWQMTLGPPAINPLRTRARELQASGHPEQAETMLRAALPGLSGDRREMTLAMLARLALFSGRTEEAIAGLRRSFEQARAAGRTSDAVFDALVAAHALSEHGQRFAEAQVSLEAGALLAEDFPEGAGQLAYQRGVLALRRRQWRLALGAFRDGIDRGDRLDLADLAGPARQGLAAALAELGRTDEALAALDAGLQRSDDHDPCNRSDGAGNKASIAIQAVSRVAGRDRPPIDPAPLLRDARELLRGCPDPFRQRNAMVNEAVWALRQRDLVTARSRLAELRSQGGGRSPALAVWELDLEAELALAEGRLVEAGRLFGRQRTAATDLAAQDGVLRAEIGQGRALQRQGRSREAVARFQAAERTLEAMIDGVPLGEGRVAVAEAGDTSARALVSALLELGRPEAAFRAARLARVRVLRQVVKDERLDQLAPEQRVRLEEALAEYRRLRSDLEDDVQRSRILPRDRLLVAAQRRSRLEGDVQSALDSGRIGCSTPLLPWPSRRPGLPRASCCCCISRAPTVGGWASPPPRMVSPCGPSRRCWTGRGLRRRWPPRCWAPSRISCGRRPGSGCCHTGPSTGSMCTPCPGGGSRCWSRRRSSTGWICPARLARSGSRAGPRWWWPIPPRT